MTSLAIIGSAGRRDDRQRVNRNVYTQMIAHAKAIASTYEHLTLVSGGAAFADHIAVELYLQGVAEHLVLHLPAVFENSRFIGTDWQHPGKIANHYHDLFSRKIGRSSLRQLQLAVDRGAEIHTYSGFHVRNLEVGKVDHLLAYTFGTASGVWHTNTTGWLNAQTAGLKSGGTSHTWNSSRAPIKEHVNLFGL